MQVPFDGYDAVLSSIQSAIDSVLIEFELNEIFDRYKIIRNSPNYGRNRSLLPASAYLSAGGKNLDDTIWLSASIELLMHSIKMFDDLQDKDNENGIWNRGFTNSQRMMNASIMLNLSFYCLTLLEIKAQQLKDMLAMITSGLMMAGMAQINEKHAMREGNYGESIYAKSSLIYGFIVTSGSILANPKEEVNFILKEIGEKFGTLYQIMDDRSDGFDYSSFVEKNDEFKTPEELTEKIPLIVYNLTNEIERMICTNFDTQSQFLLYYLNQLKIKA